MLDKPMPVTFIDDSLLSEIRSIATETFPLMQAVRRHLHTHPELSMREYETTQFLAQQIRQLGFNPRITARRVGLTYDWQSQDATTQTARVGLRADIDALPIQTCLSASYLSQTKGVMHACGHDAHSAVALGASVILKRLDEQGDLPAPVALRVILQPAEETSEGGPFMIEQGATEGLVAALALHVDPNMAVGRVASRPGAFTAGCDAFEATFSGRSGHSARPYQAVDALAAANTWMQQVYQHYARVHDCRDPSVVSIGTFQAGVAPNVIADSATLTGTVRAVSEHTRKEVFDAMHDIGKALEVVHKCRFDLRELVHTPSLRNDPDLTKLEMKVARRLLGMESVGEIELPSMGAEDFAFFSKLVPCCMFRLGTSGLPDQGIRAHSSPLHSPDFDIDERALAIGAQLLAATTVCIAQKSSAE